MPKTVLTVFLLILFSASAFSQTVETQDKAIEISVCRPSMTEAGRTASFRFNYVYLITADENGIVKKVGELLDHKKFRSLMDDSEVIPCLEKWKLKPSEKYTIVVSVGTTGGDQYLLISGKKDKIKINL